MATPVLTPSMKTEVGKFYMVPCIELGFFASAVYATDRGFVPVLGPKHNDREHLEFDYDHYHVDWRFVHEGGFRASLDQSGCPHGAVLTNADGTPSSPYIAQPPQLRRLKCKRDMLDFPSVAVIGPKTARRFRAMEAAFTACKLKPGNICPHRGIDLTPFIKPDGTVICPSHGLRWDTKTGALLPHHAEAA